MGIITNSKSIISDNKICSHSNIRGEIYCNVIVIILGPRIEQDARDLALRQVTGEYAIFRSRYMSVINI
jgi:hypothetical protein